MKPSYARAGRSLPVALMLFAGLMLAGAGAQADARHYGKWKSVQVKLLKLKAQKITHHRNHKARMSDLEDRVDALEAGGGPDISALEARIGVLEAELASLSGLAGEVAVLQADVDALAVAANRLDQLKTDVAALKTDLDTVVGDVSGLEARVAAVESGVAGLVPRTEFNALEGRVSVLELPSGGGSDDLPTLLLVNCPTESINQALDAGDPSRPITVEVYGTCAEDVVIRRDDVTIQGTGDGAPVDRLDGGILVDGASRVIIRNLNIWNGSVVGVEIGVLADKGSAVELSNVVVFNHAHAGISVRRSSTLSTSDVSVVNPSSISLEVMNTSNFSTDSGSNSFEGNVVVASNSNVDLDGASIYGDVSAFGHARIGLNTTSISQAVSLSRDSLLDGGFKSGGTVSGGVTCDNLQSLVFRGTTQFSPLGITGCTE